MPKKKNSKKKKNNSVIIGNKKKVNISNKKNEDKKIYNRCSIDRIELSKSQMREFLTNPDKAKEYWSKSTCFKKNEISEIINALEMNNFIHCFSSDCELNYLKKKLICDTDKCIILETNKLLGNEKFFKKDYLLEERPKSWIYNKNEWLDNFIIRRKMEEYMKLCPDFYFIGPVCRDFDVKYNNKFCLENELCNFSHENYLKNNITKIGVIFNLDLHTGSGTHWTSLFIILPESNRHIYYYDSVGDNPPYEIFDFIKTISNKMYCDYTISTKKNQRGSSECGIYSLHFMISMLTEAFTFHEYTKLYLPDNFIEQYREIFWE